MKILVVKLSSLGDILHMFPAVSDLRRHFPGAEIHWLVEPAFAEAVGWQSAINKVITVPLRAHKKIWWKIPALLSKLRRQLQAENYDIILDAQGLLKSALLSRLAGVAVFGFAADSARESLAARLYQKTANVQDGLHLQYKYTRCNSWNVVEWWGAIVGTANRQLDINYGTNGNQVVNDAVGNWRDPLVVDEGPLPGATNVSPSCGARW